MTLVLDRWFRVESSGTLGQLVDVVQPAMALLP